MTPGPLLVLSPHLDDAVLSAWTVLTGPGDVLVVNVCDGLPPAGPPPRWDRIAGARDAREHMEARLAEDARALALAGREAVGLGFLDAHHRSEPLDAREVLAALRSEAPAPGAVLGPAAIGGHPDHFAVREAALLLAAGSGVAVELYADLPYAARFGWPAWVTGEEALPHLVPDAAWPEWLEGVPVAGDPYAEHLDEARAAAKLRAVQAYLTQFSALDAGPLRLVSNPHVLGHEVRFPVASARPAP